MNREDLIAHIDERLDVYEAVLAARKVIDQRNGYDPKVYCDIRREHAARIVDAVMVLSRSDYPRCAREVGDGR